MLIIGIFLFVGLLLLLPIPSWQKILDEAQELPFNSSIDNDSVEDDEKERKGDIAV